MLELHKQSAENVPAYKLDAGRDACLGRTPVHSGVSGNWNSPWCILSNNTLWTNEWSRTIPEDILGLSEDLRMRWAARPWSLQSHCTLECSC